MDNFWCDMQFSVFYKISSFEKQLFLNAPGALFVIIFLKRFSMANYFYFIFTLFYLNILFLAQISTTIGQNKLLYKASEYIRFFKPDLIRFVPKIFVISETL